MLRYFLLLAVIYLLPREPRSLQNSSEESFQVSDDNKHLDLNILFDRFATRFGAFAIVAVIFYPLINSGLAVISARSYSLPGIEENQWAFDFLIVLSVLIAVPTVILGISTILPLYSWFEIKANKASTWIAALLGAILSLIVLVYIALVIMVMSSNKILPVLSDTSSMLQHLYVCDDYDISGMLCEKALSICYQAEVPNTCNDAVVQYLKTIATMTKKIE